MAGKRPHSPNDGGRDDLKRPRSANASSAPNGAPSFDLSLQQKIAEAKKKAEMIKARMAQGAALANAPPPAELTPAEIARKKLEAIKAKMAEKAAGQSQPDRTQPTLNQRPELSDDLGRARGGLGIGIHPSLLADSTQDSKAKAKQGPGKSWNKGGQGKKQLDLTGPSPDELKNSPFYDASLGPPTAGARRPTKALVFNQKGKYIAQAAALRRQAQLEEMKKKIALAAKRAANDEDNEKAFLVPEPPAVEWWDEGLVGTDGYNLDIENLKIDTEDSIITPYIQHPSLIQPPQDALAPPPKPMFLTQKEMKKKRRQERMAVHQEQQAKIRLGLEPPPPPKVKKANLMRVLGEEAIKDPTAVEARVNREIAARAEQHKSDNYERMLKPDDRRAKLAGQQEADAAKGIHMSVYKVDNLSSGKHRYQVDINAKQNALTGITLINPNFNLIIVEGGEHSIRNYRKLMLNRIKWTENSAPIVTTEMNDTGTLVNVQKKDSLAEQAPWIRPLDDNQELKDLSTNKCTLIWEGAERQRAFRYWSSKVCETDADAKDALSRMKLESFWALAKSKP